MTIPLSRPGALLVYPRLVELDSLFSDAGGRTPGGRQLLMRRPTGFELHSVREHEQGESLRLIHWPSTARRGELMVRELEDSPRDEAAVFLDADAAGLAGAAPDSTFELAVRAAGSILHAHAKRSRSAALIVSTRVAAYQRIQSLDGDWHVALELLASVEPNGHLQASAVLADESGPASRALELTVVTSALTTRLVDRLLQRTLIHHGAVGRLRGSLELRRPADPGGRARPARGRGAAPAARPRGRAGPRASARRRPRDESSPARTRSGRRRWQGRSMRRTLVGYALSSALLVTAWIGLETGEPAVERGILMALLALLPVLAVALGRSLLVIAASTALSLLVALSVAVDLPLSNARPFDAHDFFGPAVDSVRKGFLEFFDTRVPFDVAALPDMEAVILLGIFAFALAVGIAIAKRRTFLAVGLLAAGCGWPTTMLSLGATSNRDLVLGALILVTAFVLLALLRPGSRSLVPATVLGLALVVVAVGGATSDAVAKGGFVDWSRWDPYDRPDDPVDVSYVWNGNYGGIKFPDKRTVVLRVKTSGPQRYLYWRATTLDTYSGSGWRGEPQPGRAGSGRRAGEHRARRTRSCPGRPRTPSSSGRT